MTLVVELLRRVVEGIHTGMPLEDVKYLAVPGFPQPCGLVPAAGEHLLAVQRERHRGNIMENCAACACDGLVNRPGALTGVNDGRSRAGLASDQIFHYL